jgi:hypothetical protein
MIVEGQLVPMTEHFLQKIYQSPEAFKGLASPQVKEQTLFGTNNALQFSPNNEYGQGNTGRMTRDATKVASVLDNIDYVHPEDAKAILLGLKDQNIKRAFIENGHLESVKKIARKGLETSKGASLESITASLPIDRQMTYTDEVGNTILKQANSDVSKVWETKLSFADALDTPDVVANTKLASKSFIKEASAEPLAYLTTSTGKIAVNSNYDYTIVSSKGLDKQASVLSPDELASSSPNLGDTGVFVIDDKATDVFEITGIRKTANVSGWESISADYGLLKSGTLISTFVETDEFLKEGEAIVIPKNAKFIKLAKHDVSIANIQQAVKSQHERNLHKQATLTHKVRKDSANLYSLEGHEFSKYASFAPTRSLNLNEVK